MKKINEQLVSVEDESVYNKTDWTAVFAVTVIVGIVALFAWHLIFRV